MLTHAPIDGMVEIRRAEACLAAADVQAPSALLEYTAVGIGPADDLLRQAAPALLEGHADGSTGKRRVNWGNVAQHSTGGIALSPKRDKEKMLTRSAIPFLRAEVGETILQGAGEGGVVPTLETVKLVDLVARVPHNH